MAGVWPPAGRITPPGSVSVLATDALISASLAQAAWMCRDAR